MDSNQIRERIKSALMAAQAIAAKADDEKRDFTDTERAEVTAKINEANDLKTQLKTADADAKMRATLAGLGDDVDLNDAAAAKGRPDGFRGTGGKSLGEHFTTSEEYKALLATAPGGAFSKQHRVQTRPVGYEKLLPERGQKQVITGGGATSGGSLVWPEFLGLQVGLYAFERPLMLRDLVTKGTTQSDTIEYVRVTGVTNSAAPVPEATTTDGTTGVKPESGMATQRITTPVRTIAHWIPVTKRALSDAAQIRTLIDNFLAYGLEEALEGQMVAGDGTGENLTGLANTSGVQAQLFDTDVLTTLRKAKTLVRLVGRSIPTAYLLNPRDLEGLDLLKDAMGRFYFGGPQGTINNNNGITTTQVWSLPVIETEAVPQGTAYVGDWRKVILWDREQASITMSDSHASFFVQNLVAILAEMRVAFGVIQPNAFVHVALA